MSTDDNRGKRDSSANVSRRRMLQLTAGGSVAALAGCSDSNDPSTTEPTPTEGDESTPEDSGGQEETPQMSDQTLYLRTANNPADYQYNPFSTAGVDWLTMSMMHGFGSREARKAPVTWIPFLFENWELDGTTFTIEMNDQFTWHDGNSVTAEDIVLQYEICQHMGAGKHFGPLSALEGLPEATGEYSLEMQLTSEINPGVFYPQVFGEPYWFQPSFFEDYVQRFRDASSDEDKEAIREELLETNLDEPIGFGPLKLANTDSQKAEFEIHDGYPFEAVQQQASEALGEDLNFGRPNFTSVVSKFISDENRLTQEILSGGIDAARTSISDENRTPEHVDIYPVPSLHGHSVKFNMFDWGETPGNEWLRNQNVRKALAHAVDRDAAGTQLANGNPIAIDDIMSGLRSGQEDSWLDQSFLDSLDPYEYDLDAAASYLEEEGFSKDGDTWMTPDGEEFSLTLKDGACVTRYVNGMDVVNSNLQEFGIAAETIMEECSSFFGKANNANGSDVDIGYWGGASKHPFGAFDWMFRRTSETRDGEPDYLLPGDETVEVPPVGEPDSSETISIDPNALLDELEVTTDEDREQEIVETLAWATNQSVPQISTSERAFSDLVSRENFEFPPEDSQALSLNPSSQFLVQLGVIRAKN